MKIKYIITIIGLTFILFFAFSCNNNSNSSKSKSTNSSSSRQSSSKQCLCGNSFSHSGYKVGWGDNGYGMNDKIGVHPGKYCSEYCAFRFENY